LSTDISAQDRVISLGPDLVAIPERLLLAHARGEVLFICGAGVSRPAGLPDFRQLVLDVYLTLDAGVYGVLIARHRLIEAALPYFLRADQSWTQKHLITPLLNDDGGSLALWRAIARRSHFTDVLKIIGGAMTERVADLRLGRETRRRLVFNVIVESLHAFREGRPPAVPNSRIQQMLRTIDDEVRASAANAVQQFVRELSAQRTKDGNVVPAADLFRLAAAPFLREVWPQERSLATPGVSKAFADLRPLLARLSPKGFQRSSGSLYPSSAGQCSTTVFMAKRVKQKNF
jgi:hypothetical protein